MNLPPRKGLVLVVIVSVFVISSECFPARTKKARRHDSHNSALSKNHKVAASHVKVSSTKKDSVNQQVMAAVMQPGKLDVSDERDLDQFQDFNKAFINNEMAAETSLLANQGIDDDSALRISNMAALPNGIPAKHTASKTKINALKGDAVPIAKPYVAGYSPDEYLLDANSWPEYRIKDSDYYNKNYRVYPHGQQEGNYQGGVGGGMSYGQRVADGMEGPYGDGNYGYGGGPQMVSDEPSPDTAPTPQDEGSQITMSPTSMKIQKLIMTHHKKLKDPTKINFGDESSNSTHAEGSGSADSSSGSGQFLSQIGSKATHPIPEAQGKQASDVKASKEESGQVTIETKPEESSKTSDSKASSETSSTNLQGKSEQQSKDVKPSLSDQSQSNEKSSSKESQAPSNGDSHKNKQDITENKQDSNTSKQDSTESKQDNNTSKQDSNASKPDTKASAKDNSDIKPKESKTDQTQTKAPTESHNSPLGEFAKFLKAKGITLTINKEKSSDPSKESGQEQKDEKGSSAMKPESSPSESLPSPGEQTASNPTIVNPAGINVASQEASLNNAVMTWQNVSPQPNQMGGLFVRHDTKQQKTNH